MAAALIVIEIAAPKVSERALTVLVSACSRAARDAECVLARNASDEQPAAVAIVTLQSQDKIRVEVGVRQGERDSWRTKDFSFLAADETMDRWRAVGFAIGTLAESNPAPDQETSERIAATSAAPGSTSSRSTTPAGTAPALGTTAPSATAPSATAPSATAPSATAPSATAPSATARPATSSTHKTARPSSPAASSSATASAATTSSAAPSTDDAEDDTQRRVPEPARRTQLFAGASAIFGPGLGGGSPWRLGSAVHLDLAPAPMPVFFTVGGSAATRLRSGSRGVTTRWFDVSLGAGVPLIGRLEASGLEFRVEALAEYFDAHASDLLDSQTMSRWTLGLQGALGGRLKIVPNLLLIAEVQAAGLTGETDVTVGGSPIGTSSSFRYLGSVGLRVRLR